MDVVRHAMRSLRRALDLTRGALEARLYRHDTSSCPQAITPRVILDCCVFQERHSGIGRFWGAVLAQWADSGFAQNVIVLDREADIPSGEAFCGRRTPPLRAHYSRSQLALIDDICNAERADLFVSTLYSRSEGTRSLLVVHDLTPERFGWDMSQPMWREKADAIRHASAFVCISRNTASDLRRLYPDTASRRLSIATPGVDPSFLPSSPGEVAALRVTLDLPEQYFMFVGYRDIHKNAELVFGALSRTQDDPALGLLCVGGGPRLEPGWANLAGKIPVRVARLSDSELRAAYTGAAALLFVSHYEGFGLVILEAMACGCPVITCRNSALPEAAGDAAMYVDEDDPEELLAAMRHVQVPSVRDGLVARGLERSRLFDWADTAAVVEQAIREAASGPHAS